MARFTTAIASLLFLALSGVVPAAADAIDVRARELLPWVAAKTGYAAEGVKVTVLFVEPSLINQIAFGPKYSNQTSLDSISTGSTIFLPTWFKLGTNDDILVHELTHVLQFETDAQFKCRALQERQAYEMQAAFTEETGIGTKPSPMFMFLLRCSTKSVPH